MGKRLSNSLKLFFLLAVITIIPCSFLRASNVNLNSGILGQSFPGPELFYPLTKDIDLKGGMYLEFKWRRSDSVSTRNYDFRLYKGYQAVASSLVFNKIITTNEYPFKVGASTFELNQVYTWSLRQIMFDGNKSDKSSGSFKVVKK